MFEQEYREMFSQVKASQNLTRRVMMMKQKRRQRGMALGRVVLIAAVVAMMALTVSASETVQNWFVNFFAGRGGSELSQEQVEYIENNAQTILDTQSHDGWTVEMQSAIQDGRTAYIVFRVTGPENMDMTRWTDEQGNIWGSFIFGNMTAEAHANNKLDVISWPEGVSMESTGLTWLNDDDGLANTRTILIRLNPNMSEGKVSPFGPDAVYNFHFENIVWEYEDSEYLEKLKNRKYAGETNIVYTTEEIQRIYQSELLAEGDWDFTLCFEDWEDGSDEYVELITDPVVMRTNVFRYLGPEIDDYAIVEDIVTVTSVRLRHLTLRICYKSIQGIPEFDLYDGEVSLRPVVVMKDGTEMELFFHSNGGNGSVTLEARSPIIFEDVSHIRMADGTIIPMPQIVK